jgi:Transcriptional regulatory protein, C terminal/Bacterial transcriptional activator domain
MEVRVLGPLEVVAGGVSKPIGGGRQRKLLAILLLQAHEFVSSDRLVDELWGEDRPETAAKALQGYVSQLRKTLGRDALVTGAGGYMLKVAPGQLDADRFEQLVDGARAAEPHDAAEWLREALALWRGPPSISTGTGRSTRCATTAPFRRSRRLRLHSCSRPLRQSARRGAGCPLYHSSEGLVLLLRRRPKAASGGERQAFN